ILKTRRTVPQHYTSDHRVTVCWVSHKKYSYIPPINYLSEFGVYADSYISIHAPAGGATQTT
ncbi:MAG: hypothetical protein FWD05_13460, partial [Oscillospiraceae bacterium]|nr:hypothetical protein [Oscillospiraceae bacterium]